MQNDITIPDEIIDQYRYWNVEDNDWWEYTSEYWREEKLPEYGYTCEAIYFDLYSDRYADFHNAYIDDVQKIIDRIKPDLIKLAFPDMFLLTEFGDYFYISSGRYGTTIESNRQTFEDYEEDKELKVEAICRFINEFIENDLKELGRACIKDMQEEYDYLTSDEAVIETIEANKLYTPEDDEDELEAA